MAVVRFLPWNQKIKLAYKIRTSHEGKQMNETYFGNRWSLARRLASWCRALDFRCRRLRVNFWLFSPASSGLEQENQEITQCWIWTPNITSHNHTFEEEAAGAAISSLLSPLSISCISLCSLSILSSFTFYIEIEQMQAITTWQTDKILMH